jgi:hypothetical protein
MDRPRIALIMTTWFAGSHADVAGRRLIEGYPWEGGHLESRVEVVSAYLEQLGLESDPSLPDVGLEILERNAVPRFPTVAEALGLGQGGIAVDGVVIIGEHGDYAQNQYGQKLYPRRRLFDAAVAAMIVGGRTVPVFTDKHLSQGFTDARAMFETAERLDVPLLAGSSVPLAWRVPTGAQWPLDAPMEEALAVCYGPTESYGFHGLEALQSLVERREGGESGVVSVEALTGEQAARAVAEGRVDVDLLERALAHFDLVPAEYELARHRPQDVFLIEYADGLRGAVVNCQGALQGFALSARGPEGDLSCEVRLQGGPEHGHFIFLVRQIEALMLARRAPYPVERTLLTTGMLDAALHSLHDGGPERTPHLEICYRAVDVIADTGVPLPYPG